jgi:uncharacterized protein (TIGR01244 family)
MSKTKLLALSTAVSMCVVLVLLYRHRPGPRAVPVVVSESRDLYVSAQISLRDVDRLRFNFITIVDMRPDGEAPDEPGHVEMEQVAKAAGLTFHYIPVPHESIPAETVKELGDVLVSSKEPVLLYCRTGRRAVRTFALVEASRAGGPGVDAILGMVKGAGFSAEDLRAEIVSRVEGRSAALGAKQ